MGVVIGYLIGITLLFLVGVFIVNSIKSFIEWARERSKKKKSPEDGSTSTIGDVDEEPRKGGEPNK